MCVYVLKLIHNANQINENNKLKIIAVGHTSSLEDNNLIGHWTNQWAKLTFLAKILIGIAYMKLIYT